LQNGLVTAGVRKRSLDSRRLELGSNRRINSQNWWIRPIIPTFVAFDGMSTTYLKNLFRRFRGIGGPGIGSLIELLISVCVIY